MKFLNYNDEVSFIYRTTRNFNIGRTKGLSVHIASTSPIVLLYISRYKGTCYLCCISFATLSSLHILFRLFQNTVLAPEYKMCSIEKGLLVVVVVVVVVGGPIAHVDYKK